MGRWLDRIIEYLREDVNASNVVLVTRFDHRGPVRIDADRLRRVVINIVVMLPPPCPKAGDLASVAGLRGDSWELAVTDTGTGIPEQLRTGLGLAMAREIVRGHGGDIQVETRTEGEEAGRPAGSTFIISLPLSGVAAE